MPRHSRPARLALLALASILAACADVGGILSPLPNVERAGHPGFDTSVYPGDAAMRAWRAPGSPYEWVGYYLGAPCHSNTTWLGHRPFLASLGWGTAVLYVGQQTWDAVPTAAMVSPAAGRAAQSTTCSRTMLSGAQGTIEGSDAAAKAANEGFPAGTVIFLDIEYMSAVTQPMRDYYTSWVAQVLADGRYLPGVYCHTTNAPTIYADVHGEFLARRPGATPQFWITSGSGFSLDKAPTAVGRDYANVWQGRLDADETWNGVALHVDANVADTRSPSGG